MQRVSLPKFRRETDAVIREARGGKRIILTDRGKPVLRLEPIQARPVTPDDPFYSIAELATSDEQPLTNEEIDQIVYGH